MSFDLVNLHFKKVSASAHGDEFELWDSDQRIVANVSADYRRRNLISLSGELLSGGEPRDFRIERNPVMFSKHLGTVFWGNRSVGELKSLNWLGTRCVIDIKDGPSIQYTNGGGHAYHVLPWGVLDIRIVAANSEGLIGGGEGKILTDPGNLAKVPWLIPILAFKLYHFWTLS